MLALFLPACRCRPWTTGGFHWSHVPWWICGIGYVLLTSGLVGGTWAEALRVRVKTGRLGSKFKPARISLKV